MTAVDVLFIIDSTGSMKNVIKAAHDKAHDIGIDLRNKFSDASFKFGCVCYRDKYRDSNDKNEIFDFDEDDENLTLFLDDVEAKGGGGDGPEDWNSALDDAFKLTWRDGKKVIIWLADASAHGRQFGGREISPEEEAKLVSHTKKLATDNIYFTGISIKRFAKKAFDEMKKIYDENGGKKFNIEEFNPRNDSIDEMLTITTTTTVSDIINISKSYSC